MAKKRVSEMRRTKENVEEYVVPNLLGIVMRWSQLVFLTPVRLRCHDGRWAVTILHRLVIYQRFLIALTDVLVLMAFFHDFSSIQHYNAYQYSSIVSIALPCSEMLIPMTIYSLCAFNSAWRIERNMSILRQIQKMKSTFKCGAKVIKYERVKSCLLFTYISCKMITLSEAILRTAMNYYSQGILVFAFSTALTYYHIMFINFFELELVLTINEVQSTVSMLNDELHSWLEGPTRLVRPKASIRHLSDCYYNIGDMVRQMNSDNGTFLAVYVTMLFLRLLVNLYNLMIATGQELSDIKAVTREVVWSSIHIISLLILVEPSHRLQEQLKRTRRLVGKMAGESGHWVPDPTHLEPFLLQVQMKVAALEPMGMFTVARPLVASIIGGATTTLIMLTQIRNMSEST